MAPFLGCPKEREAICQHQLTHGTISRMVQRTRGQIPTLSYRREHSTRGQKSATCYDQRQTSRRFKFTSWNLQLRAKPLLSIHGISLAPDKILHYCCLCFNHFCTVTEAFHLGDMHVQTYKGEKKKRLYD